MSQKQPKPCVMCETSEATHGMDCRLCNAVMLAMVTVRKHWATTEYKGLADGLKAESIRQYTLTALERGAWISASLGTMLGHLVAISGCDEAGFKSALFRRMEKDAGEVEGLAKMPGGLDAWRRRCFDAAGMLTQALYQSARKAHNPKQPVPQ